MKIQQKSIEKLRLLINEETEYRSGPNLVSFFNDLGFDDSYGQGFPSRWIFTEDRLKNINNTPKLEECIKKVLAPINFIGDTSTLDKHILSLNVFLSFDGYKILRKGKKIIVSESTDSDTEAPDTLSENEFINREFKNVSLDKLNLESEVTSVLKQRIEEIQKCLNCEASLAVVFLCGSTLEGVLLGVANGIPKKFNQSKCAPKKDGNVLLLPDWTLSSLIDTARDVGVLGEDVKRYSHTLRDFRNYIHPYQQIAQGFDPHKHTAKISWQVLQAAIYEISEYN